MKFVVEKEGKKETLSQEQFGRLTGAVYLTQLDFADFSTLHKVGVLLAKSRRKGEITREQLWRGAYYKEEILRGDSPDLFFRWIDSSIGWGVFAARSFNPLEYIATYSGLVRRRRRSDRQNSYCYEYNVVTQKKTAYVVDAENQGGAARLINHSAKPNLAAVLATLGDLSYVILLCKELIPAGAQLCYDYGPDYWKHRPAPSLI